MNDIGKKYKIIVDYTNRSYWYVEILEGLWKGVIYSYGRLSINESKNLTFKFERNILYVPENLKDVQMDDSMRKEFDNFLGDVLVDIINKNLDNIKYKDNILAIDFKDTPHYEEAKRIYEGMSELDKLSKETNDSRKNRNDNIEESDIE